MKELISDKTIFRVPDDVYLPADDSFLIEQHSSKLKGNILDVGCGSGFLSIMNVKNNPENTVTGIDINPNAVVASRHNAKTNNILNTEFIESDLFEKLPGRTFGAIVFNPPYLPTSDDEKLVGDINRAFDGGADGREVLDRFISIFSAYLKPKGVLLLVQSSLNDPDKTITNLEKLGFKTENIAEESFFFEKLMVLKASKS